MTKLNVYVCSVIVAGATLLVKAVAATGWRSLAGPEPGIFFLFVGLLLAGELLPIKWLRRQGGGEVTASWTFAFALLLFAPVGGVLAAMALASGIADVSHRKGAIRVLFNAGQTTLSLGAGAAVLNAFGMGRTLVSGEPVTYAWLLVTTLAAIVVFTLNSLCTLVVIALNQAVAIIPTIRRNFTLSLSTDGMLLALAPIFVVVSQRSIILLPLLLVTAWAVYQTAHLALDRQHDATHDHLTGLANRRLFEDQAAAAHDEANRRGHGLALVLLDLDDFKAINDRLGHAVGDHVLQEVAARLQAAVRSSDVVARFGGDEFAILLTHVDGPAAATRAARSLCDRLSVPLAIEGFPLTVSGSFGVACYPDQGHDLDTLLEHADVAMYAAKDTHEGVRAFEVQHARNAQGRLSLLSELHRAIEEDQLLLHYQPKIALGSEAPAGVEALVRWQHPRLGLVYPGQFMPLAEHTDLMTSFTAWVLDRALGQCAAWHRVGVHTSIAVNGSARNLHDLRFPAAVERALAAHSLDPRWLELEITENTVMTDPVRSATVLARLRAMGVRITIDDFGTGFSSLTNLRDLPVDGLKIDKSFVGDLLDRRGNELIVRATIDLARNLGLDTVAEGIEDEPTLAVLTELGCEFGQGYLIGRPGTADQLVAWLARHHADRMAVEAS